ncbi:hypothetical protein [Cohnella abietis]|uniref:Uncharacterized protein n=1 Tax=Cohnella abietis TaxID=2507935 RepID=A0A3T1D1A0_9BACL|nr:hypothetical protein [Cohnella abietis]BBI31892.1 hypothetical protein KCTCHS21_12910 [Cohnella abietis]
MQSQNKKYITGIFLIGALAILTIVFIFSNQQNKKKLHDIHNQIDQAFIYQIGETESSLNRIDLSEPNDVLREYPKLISQLSAVSALSRLTSYEKENELLNGSLYSLYIALLQPENNQEIINTINSDTIQTLRETLKQLHDDPLNNEITKKIANLSSKLLNK